ncbi:MAG: DUF262 domain-containing protein [Sulfurimonas sp.]|nr:DUF262 domain-containing protein [Sulfurimonas sp.]
MEKKKMTKNFLELIKAYKITIPLIQRDYAQGREEEKSKANNFLSSIVDGTKTGLNLDFIYGKVDEEKKEFLPLDGQQRLTTLLLLHWFTSLENEYIPELNKFSYEVRSSTKDFINKLTQKDIWEKFSKKDIKKSIENANWFFLSWKNDLTVVALLNMLDLIEKKFENVNSKELSNITFEFLNLNKFKLTDELYVKMNARGKPLTDFENFKSNFEKYVKEEKIKAKLDNEWLDIFWEIAQKEIAEEKKDISEAPKLADEMFYNFFENLTLFFDLNNLESIEQSNLLKFKFSELHVKNIETILDCLINYKENDVYTIREIDIFQDFLKPYIKNDAKQSVSYEHRARFYGLTQFFVKVGCVSDENKEIFKSWMRVNLNLINNTTFNNIENFKNLILIINKLSENITDIYRHIKTITLKNESEQFTEEELKAELIISDLSLNWEEEFIKAEKHWYLDGQVKFLIEFADNILDTFIEYRDNFFTLFDKNKIFQEPNNNDNISYQTIIHRALLTYGNYLPKHGNGDKFTFCDYDNRLRVKNENWRRVFKSEDKYFQKLLAGLTNADVETLLKSQIKAYPIDCNDWKLYCINPTDDFEVISRAKHYQIKFIDEDEIYLNRGNTEKTSWQWARVSELYSYYLYLQYFQGNTIEPFTEIEYWDSSSPKEEAPCIVLNKWYYQKNHIFDIAIYYVKGFHIVFRNRNGNSLPANITTILRANDFEDNDNDYTYKEVIELCSYKVIMGIVKKLCCELVEQE